MNEKTKNALLSIVALCNELAVNVFDGSDIKTTGRLYRNEKIRIFVDLTRDDCFLLVSAGHAAGDGHRTLAAADIVLLDQALGIFAHGF